MAKYPLEGEAESYTPPSLRNLKNPPSFDLRYGTKRDQRTFNKLMRTEGIRTHSVEQTRAEMLRGLQANWSPEAFAEWEGRVKAWWDAADLHAKQHENNPERPPFVHPDTELLDDLTNQITRAWEPLRAIGADNMEFFEMSRKVLLCPLLVGWEGINVTFGRAAGIVPIDKIYDIEDALDQLEKDNSDKVDDVGAPGTAFLQLCAEAGQRMFLSEEERKNSESPSLSDSTQQPLPTDGQESEVGSSKAPASSSQTPAVS